MRLQISYIVLTMFAMIYCKIAPRLVIAKSSDDLSKLDVSEVLIFSKGARATGAICFKCLLLLLIMQILLFVSYVALQRLKTVYAQHNK